MAKVKRASIAETLDFCQRVREAGGGEFIGALLPAEPEDSNACLIARNLNFDCSVHVEDPDVGWIMKLDDSKKALARQIAEKLNLSLDEDDNIILPKEIGKVASDYDASWLRITHRILDKLYKLPEGKKSTTIRIQDKKSDDFIQFFDPAYVKDWLWDEIPTSLEELTILVNGHQIYHHEPK